MKNLNLYAGIVSLSIFLFNQAKDAELYPIDITRVDPSKSIFFANRHLSFFSHLDKATSLKLQETYSKFFTFYRFPDTNELDIKNITIITNLSEITPADFTVLNACNFFLQKENSNSLHVYLTSNIDKINYYNQQKSLQNLKQFIQEKNEKKKLID